MQSPPPVPGLTVEGCKARQERLRRVLERLDLAAALICDRRYVHYFTGYWHRPLFSPAAVITREGGAVLSVPLPVDGPASVDETVVYESNRLGSLVQEQRGEAVAAIKGRFKGMRRVGCDVGLRPKLLMGHFIQDLADFLLVMRRRKDADEIAMLRFATAAAEAAYGHAAEMLQPGRTEVELFAVMQAAAAEYAGEVIGEFGNDFQIGAAGSPPRRRPAREGEIAILDLSVVIRGYCSDVCRSFVVGGRPSEKQTQAHRRVMEVIEMVEQTAQPGMRCRELYEKARPMLDGHRGWSFPHHLGHGIGLNHHEAPRLNPHWEDTLEIGDVFTVEPGLYGDDLKAGVRVEQVYHLTASGPKPLTTFPTDLA